MSFIRVTIDSTAFFLHMLIWHRHVSTLATTLITILQGQVQKLGMKTIQLINHICKFISTSDEESIAYGTKVTEQHGSWLEND